jgi:hypothetical protein
MVDLISELKSLRKGRGVLAGQVEKRVGPALREACGITERDAPGAVRRKVRTWLTDLIGRLPDDLRHPTMVAFALDAAVRLPLYQDRVHWVAEKLDRDPRTVRRRVDVAIDQLAELADADPDPALPPAAWRTVELRIAAVLDGGQPEIFMHRTVVAERDGLRELALPTPVPWQRARARVLFGGALVDGPEPTIAFARPVDRGGEHEFAVALRLTEAAPRRLVHVPTRPWELLDVRVRFGADRPARVWALEGAPRADAEDLGTAQPVDEAGEARLRVRGLVPGLSYGLRW